MSTVLDKVRVNTLTPTVICTLGSSRPIRKTVSVVWFMQTKVNIMDNGYPGKNRVKECTFIQTKMFFQETGSMVKSMERALMFSAPPK